MAKVVTSQAYSLIKQDMQRWLKNQAIFIIPGVIVFLTAIQQGKDWQTASMAMYVWGLGALIDLLRKYAGKNRY